MFNSSQMFFGCSTPTSNDLSRNTLEDVCNKPIPQYKPIHQVTDTSPIRATCFHPNGDVYVVGSNSKKLRICMYPNVHEFKHFSLLSTEDDGDNDTYPIEPEYAFQFLQIHLSSIYCVAFNDMGNLLATGSNDQTIHIIQYDSEKHLPKSNEYKLRNLHNGTVRDVMFMPNEDNEKQSCYLITAGAGDNQIIMTDCDAGMKPIRVLRGHESTVMSLHHWKDKNLFYSGSLDGTIKLWDVRSELCCSTINTNKLLIKDHQITTRPVNVVRVEESGKLLVSGHKDGTCMLYDINSGRVVQSFKAHDDEIRTLNFSPKSYYLLTGGYDNKIKLMDLQGDLTNKLPTVDIGNFNNKIVQTAWHPTDYNFITTCANGTATLWALPGREFYCK